MRKTREEGRKGYLANMHIGPLGVPPLLEEQIYSFKCTSLAEEGGWDSQKYPLSKRDNILHILRMEVRAQRRLGGKYHRFLQRPPPGLPADCRTALGRSSPETAIRPPLGCCFCSSVRSEGPPLPVESTRPAARRCALILLPCPRLWAVMSSGDRAARCVRGGWMPFVRSA